MFGIQLPGRKKLHKYEVRCPHCYHHMTYAPKSSDIWNKRKKCPECKFNFVVKGRVSDRIIKRLD